MTESRSSARSSCRWRCRRSWAASGPAPVNIVATSTIGSIAGVDTFGDLILSENVYGTRA